MTFDVQEIINATVNPFIEDREDISLSVLLSDDLYADSLKLCDNARGLLIIKRMNEAEKAKIREYNGLYIIPRDKDSVQHILISKRQINDEFQFVSTVAHEVKHAINKTDFCRIYCENNFDAYYDNHFVNYFDVWDEYTARKIGQTTMCKVTLPKYIGLSELEIKRNILEMQLPLFLSKLIEITNANDHFRVRVTKALDIVARISVWREMFGADLHDVDQRLLSAMYILDKYDTVDVLKFDELIKLLDSLAENF